MTHEAWLERWLDHHTSVAVEPQAIFGAHENIDVVPTSRYEVELS